MELRGYKARILYRQYGIAILEDRITDTPDAYAIQHHEELYVSIRTQRASGRPVLLALYAPHTPLETLRAQHQTAHQEPIDPIVGLHMYQVNRLASEMDIPRDIWRPFVEVVMQLYHCYEASDAQQVELDPLVITTENELIVLNGRVIVDDNALFRQVDLAALRDIESETTPERLAREAGMYCVSLDGHIGCIVNGAGLGMTVMDMLQDMGQSPELTAAYLIDIDAANSPEYFAQALHIALADTRARALLINIFGGLTRCDEVAQGLIVALHEIELRVPLIIRLEGTNALDGRMILAEAALPGVRLADTLTEVVQMALDAAKGYADGNPGG